MNVSALFPWRPGCSHRDGAARWVLDGWHRHHPGHQLLTSLDLPQPNLDVDGKWCKSRHIDELTRAATGDVLVISDVDVWATPDAVREAITAVVDGPHEWAVPYTPLYRLNQEATLLELTADGWPTGRITAPASRLDQAPYTGHPGGGILVARPATLRAAPPDPHFTGWCTDDDTWACTLTALHGPPWRHPGGLFHFWHPPQPRRDRHRGSPDTVALTRQYARAATAYRKGNQAPLEDLINAARERAEELHSEN